MFYPVTFVAEVTDFTRFPNVENVWPPLADGFWWREREAKLQPSRKASQLTTWRLGNREQM